MWIRRSHYNPKHILYPEDFDKHNGVHIEDDTVNEYVQEIVALFHDSVKKGEDPGFAYKSSGDVTVMVYESDFGYEVQVYRNPDTCVIFNEDFEKEDEE